MMFHPVGARPTNITPATNSGGNWNTTAKANASNGMIVNYCASAAIKTLLGCFNTPLKSSTVRVNPIPNMIIPNNREICGAIHVNPNGKN